MTEELVKLLEARGGIEPPNKGFADLRCTGATDLESIQFSETEEFRPVSVRSACLSRPKSAAKPPTNTYWFRVPDDEAALMSLRPAELKCYLVVTRAIQRDRNGGKIAERQVLQRAGVSLRHAHDA